MNVYACRAMAPRCLTRVTGPLQSPVHPQRSLSLSKLLALETDIISRSLTHLKTERGLVHSTLTGSCCSSRRQYSAQPQTKDSPKGSSRSGSLTESKGSSQSELTVGQKVAQAGKDATYTGIVLVGIGVTGLMFFAIGRELLSGNSPSGVYSRAFKLVKQNDDVYVALGRPLKSYGEMTRRGRRRYTSHAEFEKDGVKYMRMKFYVEGPSGKADVHLEAKKTDSGGYDFRYIFVEASNMRTPIIVVDNR